MTPFKIMDKFADKTIADRGERWTVPRKTVFDALVRLNKPITAYQLLELINDKAITSMKPPTVYRALTFLQEMGLAQRIEGLNAYQLSRDQKHHDHQHVFLICDSCGDTDEYCNTSLLQNLIHSAQKNGFKTNRPVIELHGSCKSCQ